MRSVETTAKTRQEAIKKALEELGAELHEVQIEILNEGSRGIFGLGARDVKVKLTLEKDVPTRRRAEKDRDRDQDKDRERPRSDRGRGDRDRDRDRGRRGERPAAREERPARPERPATARGERPAAREQKPSRPERQERGPHPDRPPRPDRGPRPERPPKPERTERSQRPERPQRPRRPEPREARPEPAATESRRAVSETPAAVRQEERDIAPVSDVRREEATALLAEVVGKMGIEAQVTSSLTEDGRARMNVESPDSAILIGRKGRNLQAIQYLLNRMMRPEDGETVERFIVDIESYLDRRRESLEEMARHLAERAKETGRDVRVKPLSPQERRIIHLTLQDDPDIRTFSLGTSSIRTVVISPKNAARTGGRDGGPSRRPRGGRGRRNDRGESPRSSSEPAAGDADDEDIITADEEMPVVDEDIREPDEDIRERDEDDFESGEEAADTDAKDS